jgi:hypothetical protein
VWACLQEIKSVMPPLLKIEESLAERSTDSFPPPLNMAPLPPMIVTEKVEARPLPPAAAGCSCLRCCCCCASLHRNHFAFAPADAGLAGR